MQPGIRRGHIRHTSGAFPASSDGVIAFPLPTPHSIPAGIVVALHERALARRIDCAAWFAPLGLKAEDFRRRNDEPPRLPYAQHAAILRRALADFAPDEGIGLDQGGAHTLGDFGLLGLTMLTAPRFAEALDIGLRFAAITGTLMRLRLHALGEHMAFAADMLEPCEVLEPFLCEELFGSCLALGRGLVGPAFDLVHAQFRYAPPPQAARYAEVLGCPVNFAADENRVLFARHWLDHPMPAHDSRSSRTLQDLCAQRVPRSPADDGLLDSVRHALLQRLGENPGLAEIAGELGVAERTLRRRLAQAGISFQQLHDRLRHDLALRMLQLPQFSVAKVSSAVGFRDCRDFRRAFRRWSGHTPQEARGRLVEVAESATR
jgi:AraC-like DNA-binding protein